MSLSQLEQVERSGASCGGSVFNPQASGGKTLDSVLAKCKRFFESSYAEITSHLLGFMENPGNDACFKNEGRHWKKIDVPDDLPMEEDHKSSSQIHLRDTLSRNFNTAEEKPRSDGRMAGQATIPAPVTDLFTAQDASRGYRSQTPVLALSPETFSACGPHKTGILDAAACGPQSTRMLPSSPTYRLSEAQKPSLMSASAKLTYDHLTTSSTIISKYIPFDLCRKLEDDPTRRKRRERRQKQRIKAIAARHNREARQLDEGHESRTAVCSRKAEYNNLWIDEIQVDAKDQPYFNSEKVYPQTASASVPLLPKALPAQSEKHTRHKKSFETGVGRGCTSKNLSGGKVFMQYKPKQPSHTDHALEREHNIVNRSTIGGKSELSDQQNWAETRKGKEPNISHIAEGVTEPFFECPFAANKEYHRNDREQLGSSEGVPRFELHARETGPHSSSRTEHHKYREQTFYSDRHMAGNPCRGRQFTASNSTESRTTQEQHWERPCIDLHYTSRYLSRHIADVPYSERNQSTRDFIDRSGWNLNRFTVTRQGEWGGAYKVNVNIGKKSRNHYLEQRQQKSWRAETGRRESLENSEATGEGKNSCGSCKSSAKERFYVSEKRKFHRSDEEHRKNPLSVEGSVQQNWNSHRGNKYYKTKGFFKDLYDHVKGSRTERHFSRTKPYRNLHHDAHERHGDHRPCIGDARHKVLPSTTAVRHKSLATAQVTIYCTKSQKDIHAKEAKEISMKLIDGKVSEHDNKQREEMVCHASKTFHTDLQSSSTFSHQDSGGSKKSIECSPNFEQQASFKTERGSESASQAGGEISVSSCSEGQKDQPGNVCGECSEIQWLHAEQAVSKGNPIEAKVLKASLGSALDDFLDADRISTCTSSSQNVSNGKQVSNSFAAAHEGHKLSHNNLLGPDNKTPKTGKKNLDGQVPSRNRTKEAEKYRWENPSDNCPENQSTDKSAMEQPAQSSLRSYQNIYEDISDDEINPVLNRSSRKTVLDVNYDDKTAEEQAKELYCSCIEDLGFASRLSLEQQTEDRQSLPHIIYEDVSDEEGLQPAGDSVREAARSFTFTNKTSEGRSQERSHDYLSEGRTFGLDRLSLEQAEDTHGLPDIYEEISGEEDQPTEEPSVCRKIHSRAYQSLHNLTVDEKSISDNEIQSPLKPSVCGEVYSCAVNSVEVNTDGAQALSGNACYENVSDEEILPDEERDKVVGETEHTQRAPGTLSASPTDSEQERIVGMAAKDRDTTQIGALPIPTVITSRSGFVQNRGVVERNLKPVLLSWRDVVDDLTRASCLQSGAPLGSAQATGGNGGSQHVQVDSEQDKNYKSDERFSVSSSELVARVDSGNVTLEETSSVSGNSGSLFKHSPTPHGQLSKNSRRCLVEVPTDLDQNEQSENDILSCVAQEPGHEFTHDASDWNEPDHRPCPFKEGGNAMSETREKHTMTPQNLAISPTRIQEFQSVVKGFQEFNPEVPGSAQCESQVMKLQAGDIAVGEVNAIAEVVSDTEQFDSTSINLSCQKITVEAKESQPGTDLSQQGVDEKKESEMVKRIKLVSIFDQEQQAPSVDVDLDVDEEKLLRTPEEEQESEDMDIDLDFQGENLCSPASDGNGAHHRDSPAVQDEPVASQNLPSPRQVFDQEVDVSDVQDKAVDETHCVSGEVSKNSVLSLATAENQNSSVGSYLSDHSKSCDASPSTIASSACKVNLQKANTGKETLESSPSCETSLMSISVSAIQRTSEEVVKSNVSCDSAKMPPDFNLQCKTKQAYSEKSSSPSLMDLETFGSTSSVTDCSLSSHVQETICSEKLLQGEQVPNVHHVDKEGLMADSSCHGEPTVSRDIEGLQASGLKQLWVLLKQLPPSVWPESLRTKHFRKETEPLVDSECFTGRTNMDVSRQDQLDALNSQAATSVSSFSRNVRKSPEERLKGKADASIPRAPAVSKRRADPERIDFFDDSYIGAASSASNSDSSDDELSEGLESPQSFSSAHCSSRCDSPDVGDKNKSSVIEEKIGRSVCTSTVQSAGQYSLDYLLKEVKDNEGVRSEIQALQKELHKGILLGGFEVVGENECNSDDDGLDTEHLKALEQLKMTTRLIPDVHPGEAVLHVKDCGRLFTEGLSPLKCGFSTSGSGGLEKLLVSLQPEFVPDLICSGILSMCKIESAACKNALMRWLFFLSSVHSHGMIALKCVEEIAEMIQWQMEHNANKKAGYYTWSPDVSDVLRVLMNWGAKQEEFVFDQNVIENIDQLSEVLDSKNTVPKLKVTYQNIEAVLRVLSSCLQARPCYNSGELSQLLLMVCKLALDPLLSNQSLQYEIQVCLSSIVECFSHNQWHILVPSLSRQLARLPSHHHSQVYLAQHLGFSSRSRQLQQQMAFLLLREALLSSDSDSGDHDKMEDKSSFQLSDLTKLLQRMKRLVQSDHYLLYSLVQLLDICVGPVDLRLSQKKQLHELAESLQGVISEIKDDLRMMDIAKVKDMMLCMRSKWHLTLKCASERQRSLFSFWSKPEVPTKLMEERVEATSCDNESDEDASEEGGKFGRRATSENSPEMRSSAKSPELSAGVTSTGPNENSVVGANARGREMDWSCDSEAENAREVRGRRPRLSCPENFEYDSLPEL